MKSPGGPSKVTFTFCDAPAAQETLSLEDLACCLRASVDLTPEEIYSRIAQFARRSGPLFGEAEDEALADWQLAIEAAQEALRMQQQVNGTRPWSAESERVAKTKVYDGDGQLLFTHYAYFFTVSGTGAEGYSAMIPKDAWVKIFTKAESRDYLYAMYSDEGGYGGFDICAIACPSSLSPQLLSQALCFVNGMEPTREGLKAIGADKLFAVDIDDLEIAASASGRDGELSYEALPLDKSDALHLQHIVQAVAALHLRRVTVDLFNCDSSGGTLSFDSYLSALWYNFANRLGAVKIGYCQECGAGFSLTGHRGLPKQYCSDQCRTKAKNRREREKVERIRALYMEGSSISAIADELFPKQSKRMASKAIVSALAKWPKLKRLVREELKEAGEHPLTRRCFEDGVFGSHS